MKRNTKIWVKKKQHWNENNREKITKLASPFYNLFRYRDVCEGQNISLGGSFSSHVNTGRDHTKPHALPL